jgi:hypothetical protein
VRRRPADGELVVVAAADPANLLGSVVPGRRVARVAGARVLYRDGAPVATCVGAEIEWLDERVPAAERTALRRRLESPQATVATSWPASSSRRLDQRRVIEVAEAVRGAGLHQLRRVRRLRQRHAELARALQRQAEVLLVQLDAKARVEGALDHPLAVHLEDAARGEAAHQRLAHLGRVGAGAAREQQRLADRGDVEGDDDLVGDLGRLPVADAADEGDVLAHLLEQRPDALEHRRRRRRT